MATTWPFLNAREQRLNAICKDHNSDFKNVKFWYHYTTLYFYLIILLYLIRIYIWNTACHYSVIQIIRAVFESCAAKTCLLRSLLLSYHSFAMITRKILKGKFLWHMRHLWFLDQNIHANHATEVMSIGIYLWNALTI